jgi:hypothetical protein
MNRAAKKLTVTHVACLLKLLRVAYYSLNPLHLYKGSPFFITMKERKQEKKYNKIKRQRERKAKAKFTSLFV